MRKRSAFKVFHLVNQIGSEKVFLLEDELQNLRKRLQPNLNIIGLVGPQEKIKEFLARKITNQDKKQMNEEGLYQEEFIFQLQKNETAAIYIVSLNIQNPQQKNQIKNQAQAVYLCLVTSDQFYHKKPIEQDSIKYLLIRFMGDLCSHINLLYDQKIQADFEEQGCPYFSCKKQISVMRVVNRTMNDIKSKQINCDFSRLYQYDPQYAKFLSIKSSVHANYIIHEKRMLKSDFKKQTQIKLMKLQLKLWELIFQKHQTDPEKILNNVREPLTDENKKIIKLIIQIKKKLQEQIVQFGKAALVASMKLFFQYYYKLMFSWQFKQNVYNYLLSSAIELDPPKKSIKFKKLNQYQSICSTVITDIFYQVKHEFDSKYKFQHYLKSMSPSVWQVWLQRKQKIQQIIFSFYQQSSEIVKKKKMDSEQSIEISAFNIKSIDDSQKIQIYDTVKILLSESQLFQKIISYVRQVEVYDLKNSQKSKLICLKLNKEMMKNPYSLVLLSFSNNQFKPICSYKKQDLLFNFHTDNQTGYIITPTENHIGWFKIDALERMVCQKQKKLTGHRQKIVDFSISIQPNEVVFYLCQNKKALYSKNLISDEQIVYDRSKDGQNKYLTLPNEQPYEYIRAFNEDVFIALGNKRVIDIFNPTQNGKLQLRQSVKLDPTFLGAMIFSQGLNQFLIIVSSINCKALAFMNMNCSTMLKSQSDAGKQLKGNPLVDIFYPAKQKFGCYKTYAVTTDNPEDKKIHLHHCFKKAQTKNRIQKYLKELRIQNHLHTFSQYEQEKDETVVQKQDFLNEIQIRIPVQLCTLQNGNIVPLISGKFQDYHFFKELSISDRCKVLDFGIVQELLMKQPQKRVIVVGVMGAQSTGKSYLMNRLFGARFTVSSARSTIGIWLSIVKTSDVNFLLLDCEGLFSAIRDLKQQEKLIRVLTSISDYTILNQNMSMNNRSLIQLMDRIAESVGSSPSKDSKSKIYQGEMFIVVRDVRNADAKTIKKQFESNIETYRKKRSKYIQQLFGGKINFFCFQHFQNKEFQNDVKLVREQIHRRGLQRPQRTSKQILQSLKVIVNQLTCDDSRSFQEQMIKFKMEKSKDELLNIWRKGPKLSYKAVIRNIDFEINQSSVEISEEDFRNESNSCLQSIDLQFKQKIIGKKNLKTTQYKQVYQQYNQFLINFFNQRFESVQNQFKIQNQTNLSKCSQKDKQNVKDFMNKILNHKLILRLCMDKCSVPQCSLECISKFKHKYNIESQRQTVRVERDEVTKGLQINQLNPQQKEKEQKGVNQLQKQKKQQLAQRQAIKQLITSFIFLKNKINLQSIKKNDLLIQRKSIKQTLEQNQKKINKEMIKIFTKIKTIYDSDLKILKKSEEKSEAFENLQLYFNNLLKKQNEEEIYEKNFPPKGHTTFMQIKQQIKKSETNTKIKIAQNQKQIKNIQQKIKKLINQQKQIEKNLNIDQKQGKDVNQMLQNVKLQIKGLEEMKQQLKNDLNFLSQQNQKKTEEKINIESNIQNLEKNLSNCTSNIQKIKNIKAQQIKLLDSQIYQEDSTQNFIIPLVIQIKQSYKQINKYEKIKITQQQLSQINQIKKYFFTQKIITLDNNAKIQQQIKNYLNKQNKKIQYIKGNALEQTQKKINQVKQKMNRLKLLLERLQQFQNIQKQKDKVDEKIKHLKTKVNINQQFFQYWKLIESLIQLKQYKSTKQIYDKQQNEQFFQIFFDQLGKFQNFNLTQNKKQIIKLNNSQKIKTQLKQLDQDREKLTKKIDDSGQEQLQQIYRQLQDITQKIKELQDIISNYNQIEIMFKQQIKKKILKIVNQEQKNQDWRISLKQMLQQNQNIKIDITFEQNQDKKVLIDGTFTENFKEIQKKVSSILNKSKNSKNITKVIEQQYNPYRNLNLDQQETDYLKTIILQAQKNLQQDNIKNFQTRTLDRISSLNQNLNSSWLKIIRIILEQSLSCFKDKILRQKNIIQESIQKNIKQETDLIKQNQNMLQKKQQYENNINKFNLQIKNNLLKIKKNQDQLKKISAQQKQLSQKKQLYLKKQKQKSKKIDQLIRKQMQNKMNQDYENQESLNMKSLQKYLQQKKTLQGIIDQNQFKTTLAFWKDQHQINIRDYNLIKSKNKQIVQINKKVEQLEKQEQTLKNKIGDNKLEQVDNKIQKLLQEIQGIRKLKEKINQLKKLSQRKQILDERLKQLEESQKISCRCVTNHKCQQLCQACQQKNQQCVNGAGHQGIHLCKLTDHKCTRKCQQNQKCSNSCSELFNHSNQLKHSCKKSHQCQQKCNFCQKKCSKSLFEQHKEHLCDKFDGCEYRCILCSKKCASKDHNHDSFEQSVEIFQMDKETKELKKNLRKRHLCGDQHPCQQICHQKGICSFNYRDKVKKWQKADKVTNYIYTQQIEVKNRCKLKIKPGKVKHQKGQCSCLVNHTCDYRCPDCGSLCSHQINHKQLHKTEHRNQQSLIYASQKENNIIKVLKDGEQFIFSVGDVSEPTRCAGSCQAKGRGHYHLIQCKGEEKCLQKQPNYKAKHSPLVYYPYKQKQYDMVLCSVYWDIHKFEMPVYKQQFNLCNFTCPYQHENKKQIFYCTQLAWHSNSKKFADHKFACSETHSQAKFDSIQICFLIDITGSMEKFIQQCKKTVKQTISLAEKSQKKLNIRFSIVGYRDHQMTKSKIHIQLKELCKKNIKQIQKQPAKPFYSQKLTQLQYLVEIINTEKKFNEKKKLLPDNWKSQFNQKQLFILKYVYPFHLVYNSQQDMTSIMDKIKPLTLLLNPFAMLQPQPKTQLITQIKESMQNKLTQIQNQETQQKESFQKHKLIQMSNFSDSKNTLDFLQKLQASGGGDPPEAVLDGMDAICKLSWSQKKTTLKYIFHIFDAPPHGRQFAEQNGDKYPDGCPCGKKQQKIIQNINALGNIKYFIYPLTDRVNRTLQIFEEEGLKFIRKNIEKDKPEDFTVHVTQLLCQNFEQPQIMISKLKQKE